MFEVSIRDYELRGPMPIWVRAYMNFEARIILSAIAAEPDLPIAFIIREKLKEYDAAPNFGVSVVTVQSLRFKTEQAATMFALRFS